LMLNEKHNNMDVKIYISSSKEPIVPRVSQVVLIACNKT